jgi:ATP-dependent RNA helicase RhlE
MTFDDLRLSPASLRAIRELGHTEPTPVQVAAIPPALEGRDVLASAATGSGKTAAFMLPLLEALTGGKRGPARALILAPTRELAAQIASHGAALGKHSNVRITAIFGGVGFGPQASALKRGTDIIVATPGRLLDHLNQGTLDLGGVEHLVLDEGDRMLDMGFLPDVKRILKRLPKARRTMLFSATIPPPIAALAKEMLKDPVRIDLTVVGKPAAGITQTVYTIEQNRKGDLLVELLKDNNIFSALAFTRTKARADRLASLLARHDIKVERIHGNRSQAQRTRALDEFKRGRYRVLVATDIAARGLDIHKLGHVVNFDVPLVPEDYIHRVGRTARAEEIGDAITFVSREEEGSFAQIERKLGKRLNRAKTPELPPATAVAAMPVHRAPASRHAPASHGRRRERIFSRGSRY